MADFFASGFWTGFLWPLIVMIAESVLLLVVLLIAIAYILLADRKIWAAVQIRRGPNVVGPWGLFQSFADLLKFILANDIFADKNLISINEEMHEVRCQNIRRCLLFPH